MAFKVFYFFKKTKIFIINKFCYDLYIMVGLRLINFALSLYLFTFDNINRIQFICFFESNVDKCDYSYVVKCNKSTYVILNDIK